MLTDEDKKWIVAEFNRVNKRGDRAAKRLVKLSRDGNSEAGPATQAPELPENDLARDRHRRRKE